MVGVKSKTIPLLVKRAQYKRNWDLEIPQPNHPASISIYIRKTKRKEDREVAIRGEKEKGKGKGKGFEPCNKNVKTYNKNMGRNKTWRKKTWGRGRKGFCVENFVTMFQRSKTWRKKTWWN